MCSKCVSKHILDKLSKYDDKTTDSDALLVSCPNSTCENLISVTDIICSVPYSELSPHLRYQIHTYETKNSVLPIEKEKPIDILLRDTLASATTCSNMVELFSNIRNILFLLNAVVLDENQRVFMNELHAPKCNSSPSSDTITMEVLLSLVSCGQLSNLDLADLLLLEKERYALVKSQFSTLNRVLSRFLKRENNFETIKIIIGLRLIEFQNDDGFDQSYLYDEFDYKIVENVYELVDSFQTLCSILLSKLPVNGSSAATFQAHQNLFERLAPVYTFCFPTSHIERPAIGEASLPSNANLCSSEPDLQYLEQINSIMANMSSLNINQPPASQMNLSEPLSSSEESILEPGSLQAHNHEVYSLDNGIFTLE